MHMQKDTSKIREMIKEIETKSADGDCIFRGEPEYYEQVSSNLWRELDAVKATYPDIRSIQSGIIADAKEYPEDEMDDFGILTVIQHYGGKTNFIDFTTGYNVALFFACYGSPAKDGRVIILRKTEEIKKMLRYPQEPENRVRAQKSVFVEPPRGYIEQKFSVVRIPEDLKLFVLEYLRKDLECEMSPKTIYNDIYGFIRSQNGHWMAYRDFYSGLSAQNKADESKTVEESRKACEEAIEHYTRALEGNLQRYEIYNNRGIAYGQRGHYDFAIKDFDTVIQLKHDFADAYTNRGKVYAERNEYALAIEDLSKVIRLKPNVAVSYFDRGTTYVNKGDYDRAIEDFNKAIDLEPDYADAFYNRGVVYIKKDEVQHVIEDFNKAIDLNPEFAETYYTRGLVWLLKGQWANAKSDLEVASSKGIDIVTNFCDNYGNILNFKRRFGVELPEDIVTMLTPKATDMGGEES